MIENTNTKQFYPGPILNDTLEISEFLFNTAEQIKIKHSKLDEDGILRDIDLVYGQDYEVLKDEALTCDDGSEPPSHAHIMEMGLTASTGQITLKEHIHVIAGERLTAYRESAIIQDKNYPRTGAFPAATHEGALDYLTMQNQEQQDELDRALKVPISTQNFAGSMPLPIPGRALKINQDGSGFEMSEFDPDIALVTTENFRNDAQQFAIEANQSAVAAKNSETVASQKVKDITNLHSNYIEDINITSTNYLNQINSRGNTIIKDADAIINRVGLNMFDPVIKDHVLTYPDGQGLALQGTWVYRDAIAGERYGYPDFYNTCVKEFKESTTATENNITVTGTITNNNGVISGFSSANYATVPTVPTNVTSYEIGCKFTVGTLDGTQQGVLANSKTNICTPQFCIQTNNKFGFNHSLADKTWSGAIDFEVIEGGTYWAKAVWDGTTVKLFYKTYKEDTWIQCSKTIKAETINWTESLGIGIDGVSLPFTGFVDLNECYIDINGSRWWDGVRLRRHSNGHYYYPISAKATIDSRFNTNGAAWYYGVDEANKRIFLPRNNWFMQMASNSVGSFTDAGLPNITGNFTSKYTISLDDGSDATGAFQTPYNKTEGTYGGSTASSTWGYGLKFNASRSNNTYGKSSTVQPKSVKQLLYICVGNTVSDTSWVDVVTQVNNGVKDIEDKRIQSLTELENNRKQALTDLTNKENAGISALANASNALRTTQITNCLLEVPQRIKLELKNGTLTLKAGSVVIVPNGFEADGTTPKFDEVVIKNDISQTVTSAWAMGKHIICYNKTHNAFLCRINHASGTSPSGDYTVYYNTSANIVRDTYITDCEYSLPIGFATVENVAFTSIDQVFNGMGYIGSTVWVDKGVRALLTNGRNEDGTLNNIDYINDKLVLRNGISVGDRALIFSPYRTGYPITALLSSELYGAKYDEKTNSYPSYNGAWFATAITDSNGVITSFQPKQPFRAVEHTDVQTQISDLKTQLTSVVDGQWVKVTPKLLSSATAIGDYTIDLSSVLTTANCQYEVLLALRSAQNSDSFTVGLIYVTSSLVGAHSYANVMGTGSDKYQDDEFATGIIPVGSDRKIYMHIKTMKQQTVNLVLFAYRRLGTNK